MEKEKRKMGSGEQLMPRRKAGEDWGGEKREEENERESEGLAHLKGVAFWPFISWEFGTGDRHINC